MWRNDIKCKYLFKFSLKNLARKGLTTMVIGGVLPDYSGLNTSVVEDNSGTIPDSKVRGANMGLIWGQQDPGGPHVGPINFTIWDYMRNSILHILYQQGIDITFGLRGMCS